MKLLNFPIIKLTVFLILGIVISHYFKFSLNFILVFIILSITALGFLWFVLRSKIVNHPFFDILSFVCFIGIGMLSYTIQDEKLLSNHYLNIDKIHQTYEITLQIEERLKPDNYNDKYIASVKSINNNKFLGRLLINIKPDSLSKPFSVDDIIIASTRLTDIQKPLNPFQFDYSEYLELKQVYKQLYLKEGEVLIISDSKQSIYGYADKLRAVINQKLVNAGFRGDVLSIMNALLLGQRQSIDKTVYNNYVNSGTIHILAVSGLHVGILLLILNFVFSPLLYFKHGNFIKGLVIFVLLWSFAIIAGLSPSVTRAVMMFSIINVAMHLKRPTNIYNTLAISAFLILLFKPTFLLEVGFQMSYLAVLGIVSIQPIIYKIWQPKYWITDKLWQIFTVTIAAQFGVLPISLFYFHQFPGLFFISNIVVIPFLGLILGLGLLVILLALLNVLPSLLVDVYSTIINSLNGFIAWVAQFEDFLFRDIPFTLIQVICVYVFIVSLVQVYKHKTFKWVGLALIAVICFQTTLFYNRYQSSTSTFVVFNKSRFSMIGLQENSKLLVHHNLDTSKRKVDNIIKNYKVGRILKTVEEDSLQHFYTYKDYRILIIDSFGIYKNIATKIDYVLLRNSPKVNLNRVLDSLKPKTIIADASNYKTYAQRWKLTCQQKEIPFHYTDEKGAFILE